MNQETKDRIKGLINELQSLIENDKASDDSPDSFCDDDWPYDSDEELRDLIDSLSPAGAEPGSDFLLYESHLEALFDQWQKEALLLKNGYCFDKKHVMRDVTPYEFDGEGYAGSIPVVFAINKDQVYLQEVRAENITGDIYGVVFHSSSGLLIAYLPLARIAAVDEDVILKGEVSVEND
jgi:hypothetical protein